MMTRRTASMIAMTVALGVAACSQDQTPAPLADTGTASIDPSPVKLQAPFTTVKPGASVTFTHDAVKPLEVGDRGSLVLSVHEGYPNGTLTLNARGAPGLAVYGAGTTMRANMADITTHAWRIDFEAERDGVHYIGITATVEPEGGLQQSRAYAVRVEVGDWQAEKAKALAAQQFEISETGEPTIVMTADEEIDPR